MPSLGEDFITGAVTGRLRALAAGLPLLRVQLRQARAALQLARGHSGD